jgi:hypothetical protein
MPIYKVKKRNGSIATFDRKKIEKAIIECIKASNGNDFSHVTNITDLTIKILEKKINNKIPDVEKIQDEVEEALVKL